MVLEEHDIEYPIDYRESDEDMFNLERHATSVTMEVIRLRHEKECADLAQNSSNYPTGNKIVLSGASQFTDYANSDPIGVIDDGKEAIRRKIGRRPNTMVMGAATYMVLKEHPQLLDKIKYSMRGVVTVELMREIFGIERIFVGEAIYAQDDGTFVDLWGDNIILAWVPVRPSDQRNVYEPSFGYTPRKRGMPETDTYDENGGKLHVVRTTDIFKAVIVGAEAGYLIEDTNG